MRYFTRIGPKEYVLDVRDEDGATTVVREGRSYRVDAVAIEPGEQYSVFVDRRSFAVSVDGSLTRLHLVVSGRSFVVDVEDERERATRGIGAPAGPSGGVVHSAMPGIVRKVLVAKGDPVKAGQRLVILEAMKMENEILAEQAGVVKSVHVSDGQTVDGGVPLITLAPPPADEVSS